MITERTRRMRIRKWVNALRSGDYIQGTRRLVRQRADGEFQWCCLGVLCDVAGLETEDVPVKGYGTVIAYENDDFGNTAWQMPPEKVYRWLGLPSNPEHFIRGLAAKNDNGKSFEQIADLIEEKYLS